MSIKVITKEQAQRDTENYYNKKTVNDFIYNEMINEPIIVDKIAKAVECITEHANTEFVYDSKNERMAHLRQLDIEDIVLDLFTIMFRIKERELFTAVVGQLEPSLKYTDEDKVDGLKTAAEIVAIVCVKTDFYDIIPARNNDTGMMLIKPCFQSEEIQQRIRETKYLPPMLVKPEEIKSKTDSGYLTIEKDRLILNDRRNMHSKEVCLDSINKFNQVPLELDVQMLKAMEMPDVTEADVRKSAAKKGKEVTDKQVEQAVTNAAEQREISYEIYKRMVKNGNEFYLTHKYDKRGRTYSQGYHVHTQGNDFKKAIISLKNKEVVEF